MFNILMSHGDGLYSLIDTSLDMSRAMEKAKEMSRHADIHASEVIEVWDRDIINFYARYQGGILVKTPSDSLTSN